MQKNLQQLYPPPSHNLLITGESVTEQRPVWVSAQPKITLHANWTNLDPKYDMRRHMKDIGNTTFF